MVNQSRLDNLDELRTYAAIAERGSLVAAAKMLGVTPNAVSRRLSVLEGRIGRRLISRTTRRMSLTEEGSVFHTRCRRILDEIEGAERELRGDDGLSATIKVGLQSDVVGPAFMSGLGTLLESAPGLRVQLRVTTSFVDPIAAGLDVSIHAGKPRESSLIAVALGSVVWCMAAAPSYVARRGKPRTPERLIEHECLRILREAPESHWVLSRKHGKPRRFAIGGRFESTDGNVLASALYAGLGIGLRLRPEIEASAKAGALERVLPDWHWTSTPLYALLPKGRPKIEGVRRFLDVLRSATTKLA